LVREGGRGRAAEVEDEGGEEEGEEEGGNGRWKVKY
jgi:hypothetical protein